MRSEPTVPFAIYIQRLFRQDFVDEHSVEFGVARADRQALITIESDRYDNPQIIERHGNGGIELADNLIDRIGLLCFDLMAGQMRQREGESGWCVIDDFTPHVQNCFDPPTAESILRTLSTQVKDGVHVMNLCAIDGDDTF